MRNTETVEDVGRERQFGRNVVCPRLKERPSNNEYIRLTEVHGPYCTETKGNASEERPDPLQDGTPGVLCVNHDLSACVCAQPGDEVGEGDKLAKK